MRDIVSEESVGYCGFITQKIGLSLSEQTAYGFVNILHNGIFYRLHPTAFVNEDVNQYQNELR
jgi:hypothetical protein